MEIGHQAKAMGRSDPFPMDPMVFVVGWLHKVELENGPATSNEPESGNIKSGVERPRTPEHHRNTSVVFDEPSPTNTNFSSVFDTIERGASNSRSPSTVSATSVGDEDEDSICRDSICGDALEGAQHEELPADDDDTSINSCDPPTELNESQTLELLNEGSVTSSPEAVNNPDPIDAKKSQQVFITSCYQCILAGLPCSRTAPACSRCKRAGCADVCLLHRRKLIREMVPGDVEENKTPTLLRLRGEDDEVWDKKEELFQELHQTWLDREERKNWVLPSPWAFNEASALPSPAKSRRSALFKHPGEGLGRLTFQQLELA